MPELQKEVAEEMINQSWTVECYKYKSRTLETTEMVNQSHIPQTMSDQTSIEVIGPAPMEPVLEAMNSVCKIEFNSNKSKKVVATGFLLDLKLDLTTKLKGMLTNRHVISPADYEINPLTCKLIFECLRTGRTEVALNWRASEYSYYTSARDEMDATFIELPEQIIDILDSRNVVWQKIHSEDAKKGDRTFILQYPAEQSSGKAAIAIGKIFSLEERKLEQPGEKYLLFKHLVDTERGSSGSPVITYDGNLIGLHRCAFTENVNGATNARCLLKAMIDHFKQDGNLRRKVCTDPTIVHVEQKGED